MRKVRVFAMLALWTLAPGCMPSVTYEPRSLPPAPQSLAEGCYQKRRIEVTAADASWSASGGGSYNPVTGVMTTTTTSWHGQGVVLYQGGERLEPDEALRRTGDAELSRAYEERVSSSTGSAVGYELSRDGSLLMAFGGLGLVTVAAVQVAGDKNLAEKGLGDFPLLWIGTGLALASIVPAIIAWQTHQGAVEHSLDSRLVPSHLVDRTFDSVRAYNRRVMAECRFEGGDELPLSPKARGSLKLGADFGAGGQAKPAAPWPPGGFLGGPYRFFL